jgi:hypothetical protein
LKERPQDRDEGAGKAEEPSSLVEEKIIVGRRERMSGYRFWKELLNGALFAFSTGALATLSMEGSSFFVVHQEHCLSKT